MARRSQTELAVLGALSTGPMTGYKMRAAITETLGHFWQESFGQIYPTLAALTEAGAVRPSSAGRTSGTIHEITSDGEERLRRLLAEPIPPAPVRNGLLLRLFFGSHLPTGAVRELLLVAEARAAEALESYAELRASITDEPGQAYRTMTLSFGEHLARAQQAWATESLAALAEETVRTITSVSSVSAFALSLRGRVNPMPDAQTAEYATTGIRTPFGLGLHHTQITLPQGGEAEARAFYVGVLGMVEIHKPAVLAARGGIWFRSERMEIHLGVETPFRAARKSHPGILVNRLDDLASHLQAHGRAVRWDDNFPEFRRFYCDDPFGNRLEFLQPRQRYQGPDHDWTEVHK